MFCRVSHVDTYKSMLPFTAISWRSWGTSGASGCRWLLGNLWRVKGWLRRSVADSQLIRFLPCRIRETELNRRVNDYEHPTTTLSLNPIKFRCNPAQTRCTWDFPDPNFDFCSSGCVHHDTQAEPAGASVVFAESQSAVWDSLRSEHCRFFFLPSACHFPKICCCRGKLQWELTRY